MITDIAQKILYNLARIMSPNEAVGFIVGNQFVFHVPNEAKNPRDTFQVPDMSPYETNFFIKPMLWHSHPRSRPTPSLADIQLMENYRDCLPFLIVSLKPIVQIHIYDKVGRSIKLTHKYREDNLGRNLPNVPATNH